MLKKKYQLFSIALILLGLNLFLSAKGLTVTGSLTILTSSSPLDENTLDEPTKVSPKTESIKFSGTSITQLFPGNSLTILRLKTKTNN